MINFDDKTDVEIAAVTLGTKPIRQIFFHHCQSGATPIESGPA